MIFVVVLLPSLFWDISKKKIQKKYILNYFVKIEISCNQSNYKKKTHYLALQNNLKTFKLTE